MHYYSEKQQTADRKKWNNKEKALIMINKTKLDVAKNWTATRAGAD